MKARFAKTGAVLAGCGLAILAAVFGWEAFVFGLARAAGGPPPGAEAEPARPLRVVATIFPVYDWVREVVGTNAAAVEVSLLLDGGVDPHSYQPTAVDLRRVAGCDLFVHVGGESDGWVAPALAAAPNPRRRVLALLDALGPAVRAEEDHEGHTDHEGHEGHEPAVDEHVWLSLRRAALCAKAIAEALAAADTARGASYRAGAEAYAARLAALDADYAAAVAAAPRRTLVVPDRFPLRYLADDYGLSCHAAFEGCGAEAEASFQTIARLAREADALGAHAFLTMEGADRRLAEAVRKATATRDQDIVAFDSMQSTTAAEVAAGKTYLGTMRANLAALAAALR